MISKNPAVPAMSTLFDSVSHVFREHRSSLSPIEAFIIPLARQTRRNEPRKPPVTFILGNVATLHMTIYPMELARTFVGPDLVAAIARIYNDDYWLFSLWNHFADAAQGSSLSREVVRAFIKHCIYVTVEEVATQSVQIDHKAIASYGRINRIAYYKQVFDWSQIWQCLRAPSKRKLERQLRRKNKLAHGQDFKSIRATIPELEALFREHNLPRVIFDMTDQPDDFGGFLRVTYLALTSARDSRRLRKAIRQLVRKPS
jgi:hypothetical protein